jgi:PmbA protein
MMSGNVFEMLGNTAGLGKDDRVIGSLVVPSIRLIKQHIIGS